VLSAKPQDAEHEVRYRPSGASVGRSLGPHIWFSVPNLCHPVSDVSSELKVARFQNMHLQHSETSLGATVTDVDLSGDLSGDVAVQLRAALDERGVLVFPGQHVDHEGLKNTASVWAPPQPHPVIEFVGGEDVIGVVFNDKDHLPAEGGDSAFHTDYSFNAEIPDVAVLTSITAPPVGGNTMWSDSRAAAASLSTDLHSRARTWVGHHDAGPRFRLEMANRMGEELADKVAARFGFGFRHPVLTAHPRTGDELLFVNPGYVRYIVGVAESDAALAELYNAFQNPAHQFEHAWTPGDVVIWDEHRTVHRGPNDFAGHERELHRCTAGHQMPAAYVA
jgi:taurine dioxygenase